MLNKLRCCGQVVRRQSAKLLFAGSIPANTFWRGRIAPKGSLWLWSSVVNMYYVYFLKSKIKELYYIGVTKNIDKRLEEHNKGRVNFTNKYKPWDIKYTETFTDKKEAYKREYYLKHPEGYLEKIKIIKKINGEVA